MGRKDLGFQPHISTEGYLNYCEKVHCDADAAFLDNVQGKVATFFYQLLPMLEPLSFLTSPLPLYEVRHCIAHYYPLFSMALCVFSLILDHPTNKPFAFFNSSVVSRSLSFHSLMVKSGSFPYNSLVKQHDKSVLITVVKTISNVTYF